MAFPALLRCSLSFFKNQPYKLIITVIIYETTNYTAFIVSILGLTQILLSVIP